MILDILAFSETWLNPSISTTDLYSQSYTEPERKDRIGDSHGELFYMSKPHYIIGEEPILNFVALNASG